MEDKYKKEKHKIFFVLFLFFAITMFLATYFNNWILSIAITIVASLAITISIQKNYRSSLSQILYLLKSINKNDLMIKIDKETQDSKDDILKEILKLFEDTKSNFKRQVDIATQISTVSEQINTISCETQSAMEVVAASAEVTTQGTEQQLSMLSSVSGKIYDVVNNLNQIDNEMDSTATFTIDSIKGVQLGIQDTNEIKEKVRITRDLVKNTATNVDKLIGYSEDVVNMIGIINSIAEQTNMLALNASIEAARAGEQGKGFGVVATEVGKLSKETSEASSKIEEVLSVLKAEIHNISEAMGRETTHVEEEFASIEKTADNFSKIQEDLKLSVEKLDLMSGSIKNINTKSTEIQKGVDEVTDFSKTITSEMQETAAQVTVQNEKMTLLNNIIEELSSTADEMQQYVTSKVMEGKMLKDVQYIMDTSKGKNIDNNLMEIMLKETGVDVIYITDTNGEIRHCNEKESIGLNLYKIDTIYEEIRSKQKPFASTPIKRRYEDNELFKFLAMTDESGIIYQVGLSINSLLKF
ncbi:MAG: methyl-accepting chemotaxis protein [Tissierellales bacterium]